MKGAINMRNLLFGVMACVAAAVSLPAAAADLGAQKSVDRGVTVTITPQNLFREGPSWDFKIVLDTHSQNLADDLVKSSVLLDGATGRYAPIAWEGAVPGGHHREGILRFKPISPAPASIEVQVMRNGESAARSFRWPLAF
jgi:hypothetical protein